jgi:hypothetical protein
MVLPIISVRWTLSEVFVAAEFRTYLKQKSRIFPAHYRLGNSATRTKDIMNIHFTFKKDISVVNAVEIKERCS